MKKLKRLLTDGSIWDKVTIYTFAIMWILFIIGMTIYIHTHREDITARYEHNRQVEQWALDNGYTPWR